MPEDSRTAEVDWQPSRDEASKQPVPGIVVIHCAGRPALAACALVRGARGVRELVLGRATLDTLGLTDGLVSRSHARVSYDGERWSVADLGSRNGTSVDGVLLLAPWSGKAPRVVRIGDTVLVALADARRFLGARVLVEDGAIVGPTMALVRDEVRRAARAGDTLFIAGESGAGKDLIARTFHASHGAAGGPFVAVNCATIAETIAERLLFGARRGAFSGAENAEGYLLSADGGTLFLDEIAELSLAVQAKLLRVLETREVLPLGASRAQRVNLRLCAATHRELRAEVAAGRFRADLYYRVGTPSVTLPALRERPEEIPWLADHALVGRSAEPIPPTASLIEELLRRPWPGNVRELLVELRAAARSAQAAGATAVDVTHLSPAAGQAIDPSVDEPDGAEPPDAPEPELSREDIEAALRREGGNVTRAAKALGMHRTQLRRWKAKHWGG